MNRHHYEITHRHFYGGTDETDNLVFWVRCPDSKAVEAAIEGSGATQWHLDFEPSPDCVDFVLPQDAAKLVACLRGSGARP